MGSKFPIISGHIYADFFWKFCYKKSEKWHFHPQWFIDRLFLIIVQYFYTVLDGAATCRDTEELVI